MPGPIEASNALQTPAASKGPPTPPLHPAHVVAVHWEVDEATESISLSTSFVANPADQPFRAEPSTAVIAGSGSAKFTLHFSTPDAMLHDGYLLGAQRIMAPESRVALHCSVTEEPGLNQGHDEAEERQAGNMASQVVSTDPEEVTPSEGRGQSQGEVSDPVRRVQNPVVTCQLSGGFHPYAAPPTVPVQPLRMNLNANVIQPHLEPEFPDATDCLSFVCHATNDPATHPSYRQTVMLTNMHSCPLQFSVSMAGAGAATGAGQFQILRAVCGSVSRLQGLQPKPLLTSLGSSRGTKQSHRAEGHSHNESLMLRPHEHVTAFVQYKPQQHGIYQIAFHPGASSADIADATAQSAAGDQVAQDESATDQLVVMFSNGYQQAVPVIAHCLHPVLQTSVVRLDFGAVHMQSPKTLEVELFNPSLVDAKWSAQISTVGYEASTSASVSFAQGGQLEAAPGHGALSSGRTTEKAAMQQRIGAGAAFTAAPGNGVLTGRGLTMPKKQKLLVTFAPKQAGLCTAELSVIVAQGSTVRIVMSGEGTYREGDEVQASLRGI